MAFTSNCDLFVSVNEAGINQIIHHVMRQRPSLFNYATAAVIRNPKLLCAPIDVAPIVIQRGNPLLTLEPPLPVIATHPQFGLNFAVQLTKAEVDFSPGNVIALPAELNPPLPAQRLALHFEICAGLGCPPDKVVSELQKGLAHSDRSALVANRDVSGQKGEVIVLPSSELTCFCLDLFGIGEVGQAQR